MIPSVPNRCQRATFQALRGAVSGVALAALLGAANAEAAKAQVADEGGALRGELVRHPDGTLDVAVIAPGAETVPAAIWERIRSAGRVSFMAPAGGLVATDLRARLEALVGDGGVREVSGAAGLAPVGVAVEPGGELRVGWYRVTEEEGVEILAVARSMQDDFGLRILILDPAGDQDDWWGLQAALSRAGIRRVQILSGPR